MRWGTFARSCKRYWFPQLIVVLPFSYSCLVISFPCEVGAVQAWMLSSGSGDYLCSPLVALLWRWLFPVLIYWGFCAGGLFPFPIPFLWGRFCVLSAPSVVSELWWFTICFSILGGSLTLSAAHCSGDELCDPLSALLWGVAYCPPALSLPDFPVFVYW
jgi:hypothetical protein